MSQDSVIDGRPSDAELNRELLSAIWGRQKWWAPALLLMILGTMVLMLAISYTIASGIGVWGNNIPVAWGFAIINFVWWIGLGHAGTFISAFLLLLEQEWRSSINRIAEAMTLFAIVCAGIFPILHLGRPWFFYWLIPYPATMGVWPQFRSSLPMDVAAIFTYGTVSLLFWYLGLVPDLAAARDAAPTRRLARIYGLAALGFRGSARTWNRYRIGYGLLAGLATPLVVSVHSLISFDFAISNLPGWHSTIFPPYFVVGAIHSGFALVLMLVIPIRRLYGYENVITIRHLDTLARVTLVTGSLMLYSYVTETFMAWYSGDRIERFMYLVHRPFGIYSAVYWFMWTLNAWVPQLFWFKSVRRNPVVLWFVCAAIFIGMWIERFELIITAESADFLPSSWQHYFPTLIDWTILLSSLALFCSLFLLFMRYVPMVPLHEVKKLGHRLHGNREPEPVSERREAEA